MRLQLPVKLLGRLKRPRYSLNVISKKQAKHNRPTNHAKMRILYSAKALKRSKFTPQITGIAKNMIKASPKVAKMASALYAPNVPIKLCTSAVAVLLKDGSEELYPIRLSHSRIGKIINALPIILHSNICHQLFLCSSIFFLAIFLLFFSFFGINGIIKYKIQQKINKR